MAYSDLLTHRMTIRRRATGTDRFNQKSNVHLPVATGRPCRVTRARGGERTTDKTANTVVETLTLFALAEEDLRENDKVDVYAADGTTLLADDAGVTHVRIVTDRYGLEHHREIDLEVIRSAT
jgi:hypothetical protein